jgi:hypothetical protein
MGGAGGFGEWADAVVAPRPGAGPGWGAAAQRPGGLLLRFGAGRAPAPT